MSVQATMRRWAYGWVHLLTYDQIPRYRRLNWMARKRIDCRMVAHAFRSHRCWWAVLQLWVWVVLAYSVSWHMDMGDTARDLFTALPVIVAAPWLSNARRKKIAALLRVRDVTHRQ